MSHPTQSQIDQFLADSLVIAEAIDAGVDPFTSEAAQALVGALNADFAPTVQAGGRGTDVLTADAANPFNVIVGFEGTDVLLGRSGSDALAGETGSDVLIGRAGDDLLFGGQGSDSLAGGSGNDILIGGRGSDILRGGKGDDDLSGGNGTDLLRGGKGNDALSGGNGTDILNGGKGNDKLSGDNGADILRGGQGDDVLEGGRGNDQLFGGDGADQFVFDPSDRRLGDDVIRDFGAGDSIVLAGQDIIDSLKGNLGDDGVFGLDDLNAETGWGLSASSDGDLLVTHPGGTIEVDGVAFSDDLSLGGLISDGVVQVV
ncbi:MAG: calcium-binding protein [Pseudomonadota bacterium]